MGGVPDVGGVLVLVGVVLGAAVLVLGGGGVGVTVTVAVTVGGAARPGGRVGRGRAVVVAVAVAAGGATIEDGMGGGGAVRARSTTAMSPPRANAATIDAAPTATSRAGDLRRRGGTGGRTAVR